METALAYLHTVSAMGVASCLVAEFCLCNEHLQPGHVSLLVRVDLVYIGCAVLAFLSGLAAVFVLGQGPWATLSQPWFWVKLAAFGALVIVSIFPTSRYARWSRAIAAGNERILSGRELAAARRVLVAELALLALIPLLASLLARSAR